MRIRDSMAMTVAVSLCVAACPGCRGGGQSQPTTTPSMVTIPIAVHVFLENNDVMGGRANVGCRLTQQEIEDHISSLLSHNTTFGSHVTFTRDTLNDQILYYPDGSPADRTITTSTFYAGVAAEWKEGFINIWFVGNVQDDVMETAIGITVDPAEAATLSIPDCPIIIINDGGFELASGFADKTSPSEAVSYYAIEHEMTHYLGRFTNQPIGSGLDLRDYDGSEHCDHTKGAGNNCILRDSQPPPGPPLVIPGKESDPATELGQISKRIQDEKWNNP